MKSLELIAALGRDMRVGLRSLLRARGMSATVVVTLALGIGAAALLAATAVLASLLPAARASRVDVLRALRSE